MIEELTTIVTDGNVLLNGYIVRDGFVFALGEKPAVYDTLVIRSPVDAVGPSGRFGFSERSLEDHITLINKYELKNAKIICNDLSFILQCPSLQHISVYPEHNCGNNFDYSPLYELPHIKRLCCLTTYGVKHQYRCTIDYAKINGVVDIAAAGSGHIGYERVPTLETLWISNDKKHKDFRDVSCSPNLKDVTSMQCSLQTLDGIEKHCAMQSLALYHNRSLKNISALSKIAVSLKQLSIEGCPKITDFSVLDCLENLEHLHLYGSQVLPNLNFLSKMKKLKTFTFTMDVEDGDLSLCMELPYASCKNRKHFNLKDSQLPK